MSNEKFTPEICGNCGGVYGIHQSITLHCPFGGHEGDGTRWMQTTWINRKFKLMQDAAPDMYEALKYAKEVIEIFIGKRKLSKDDLFMVSIDKAKAALSKANPQS